MSDHLKKTAIKGMSWSFIGQIIKQVLQFVFNVVLARLLLPADFGLLAMASVFANFALIFADMGISNALIQRKNVTEEHWSSAFWLNIALGIILAVIFALLSPLIAGFFGHESLGVIIMVMSLNFVLASMTMVQQSMLTRQMNFFALMVRDVGSVLLSGGVAIVLAYRGWGIWCLVAQLLLNTFLSNVFLWTSSTWRPKFIFSMPAIKDFFNFSAHLTGFQVLNYFSRNLDQLLIGRILGSEALGYYSLAYKLMMLPLYNISWVLSKVMFPVLSKVQDDKERLHRAYLKMVKSISLITFPIMSLFFVLAPEIIFVAYGPKWSIVADIVRILCFCGMMQSVATLAGLMYQSVGKTYIQLRMGILNVTVVFLALIVSARYGLISVTVGYTLAAIAWAHFSMFIVARTIGLKFTKVYASLMPAFGVTAVLFAVTLSATSVVRFPAWGQISLIGMLFAVVYAGLLFWMGEVKIQNKRIVINLLHS